MNDYYDTNAASYIEETGDLDMSFFANRFLQSVPTGGTILDAGCGSGRDALFFHEKGYRVTAFDSSKELVRLASQWTKLSIEHRSFHKMSECDEYDGIWASASLLHLNRDELPTVFSLLCRALKEHGVLYASFKMGQSFKREGLLYTSFTSDEFRSFIRNETSFIIDEMIITEDARAHRKGEYWLNAFLRKMSPCFINDHR